MTGILLIAKGSSSSSLNGFNEFTMISDNKFYKYFGFSEKEVGYFCDLNIY